MVKKCVICLENYYCERRSRSLHMFPRNISMRTKWLEWLQSVGYGVLTPSTNDCICSNHFIPENFYEAPSGKHILRKTSVPSAINLIFESSAPIPTSSQRPVLSFPKGLERTSNPTEEGSSNENVGDTSVETAEIKTEPSGIQFVDEDTVSIPELRAPASQQLTTVHQDSLSNTAQPEQTSTLWHFGEGTSNNSNAGQTLVESMEIKTEPCKLECADDEDTISIPELRYDTPQYDPSYERFFGISYAEEMKRYSSKPKSNVPGNRLGIPISNVAGDSLGVPTSNVAGDNLGVLTDRLKCRTCMESVPKTALPVTAMHFKNRSVKDAINQLIPQLAASVHDQDLICNKCLEILEETVLFIQNCLKVNKLLVEEDNVRDINKNVYDPSPPGSPCIVDPTPPKSPCCSDEECGKNDGTMSDDSDDFIKVVDSDLENWLDVTNDDIELFSDSSLDEADTEKPPESSNGSKDVKTLRRINYPLYDNGDIASNNHVVAIQNIQQSTASRLLFSLEKIGVKFMSNLDKPDLNNSLRKKRILLIGNEAVKYCLLCRETFSTEDKLVKHLEEAHNLSKSFMLNPKFYYEKGKSEPRKVFHCPYCNEIVGEKQLGLHAEKLHGDSKPYKCYRCKKEYRWYRHLCNHDCYSKVQPVKKKVKVKEKRRCDVCKEKISLDLYKVHFDSHKIFKCKKCEKKFTNAISLTNHETLHHSKTELCPICGKIFNGLGLQLHMANHADKKDRNKDFLCEFCPKSFTSDRYLRTHTKVVHFQTKVLCELCGKKCRPSTLPAHIRLKHSKEAIFTCAICGEGFSRSDYFNRHVASHTHKRKPYSRLGTSGGGGKGTPSKCKICSKQLTPANYYQHLNSHVTLKRFKCRFCNMSYNNYSNARRHEREHLKNPTYHFRCNICWKTFENSEDLDEHTATHDLKYSCDECGKSFGRKFALSCHIDEAHTDEAEVEKKEESLRQSYGIGLRKRRKPRKKTIVDELGDLIKEPNIEVVEESVN